MFDVHYAEIRDVKGCCGAATMSSPNTGMIAVAYGCDIYEFALDGEMLHIHQGHHGPVFSMTYDPALEEASHLGFRGPWPRL